MAHEIAIEDLLAHRNWVRALARQLVRDEGLAEDVVQGTWAAVLSRPHAEIRDLKSYLRGIVKNLSRRARRAREVPLEPVVDEAPHAPASVPPPEEILAMEEVRRKIVEAVLELREPYHTTVVLRYYRGLETNQIAQQLGVQDTTVRSRLSRAHDILRERIRRDDEDGSAWSALVLFALGRPAGGGGSPAAEPSAARWSLGARSALVLAGVALVGIATWSTLGAGKEMRAAGPEGGAPIAWEPSEAVLAPTSAADVRSPVPASTGVAPAAAASPAAMATVGVGGRVILGDRGDAADAPQAGVDVRVEVFVFEERARELVAEGHVVTDAHGRFAFDLAPRDAVLLVRATPTGDHLAARRKEAVFYGMEGLPQPLLPEVWPLSEWIEVSVFDDSGQPLAEAEVSLENVWPAVVVTTGVDGLARVPWSPAFDERFVVVSKPGYARARASVVRPMSLPVRLSPGERRSGWTEPAIAGAVITVLNDRSQTLTRDDGTFELDGLPRSTVHVLAEAPGYASRTLLWRGGEELRIALEPGATVTGRILDQDGAPLPAASVEIAEVGGRIAYTGVDGFYRLSGVALGEQSLLIRRAGFAAREVLVDLHAEQVLDFRLARGRAITGRVADELGMPVAGALGRLYQREQSIWPLTECKTDSRGEFRLEVPIEGALTLAFVATGFLQLRQTLDGALDPGELQLTLPRAGRIQARVLDARSGAPISKLKVAFPTPNDATAGLGYGLDWRNGRVFESPEGVWVYDEDLLAPGARIEVEVSADGYRSLRLQMETAVDPKEAVLALEPL